MNILSGKDLEKEASKKAFEFIEEFVERKGSKLIPSGIVVFDKFRPSLEHTYSAGYEDGYIDALKRVMEDTR